MRKKIVTPINALLSGISICLMMLLIGCGRTTVAFGGFVQPSLNQDSISPRRTLFITEALPNRTIDKGDKQLHNAECVGFYERHFPPSLIDTPLTVEKLESATRLKWREIKSRDSVINFNHLFTENTNKVVYVAECITAERVETGVLSLGSDDGFTLWANGDSLTSTHKGRNTDMHSELIPVSLRQGKNVLLYKIDQGEGGWNLFRKFLSATELRRVLSEKAADIYKDVPESCILPDTSNYLSLKQDLRRSVDSAHTITFVWKALASQELQRDSFPAIQFPKILALPKGFTGEALLTCILQTAQGKVDYSEEIPVFYERTANRLATAMTKKLRTETNPIAIARCGAVTELFHLRQDTGKVRTYSTRMKAQALLDLCRYSRNSAEGIGFASGPQVWGYRSMRDSSVQTYRVFLPAQHQSTPKSMSEPKKYPFVFVMHGVYTDSTDFWRSYEGTSHALMAKRIAFSTDNQIILVMPYGRGNQNYGSIATEELPLILEQLKAVLPIDTANISAIVWSKGSKSLIALMRSQPLPLAAVGLVSPVIPDDVTEMQRVTLWLQHDYPKTKWFIRHGLDDINFPISIVRIWIEDFAQRIFSVVDYREVPHSSHWNYLIDPESEFYRWIIRQSTSKFVATNEPKN